MADQNEQLAGLMKETAQKASQEAVKAALEAYDLEQKKKINDEVQKKYASVYQDHQEYREKRGLKEEDKTTKVGRFIRTVAGAAMNHVGIEQQAKTWFPNDSELQGYIKALSATVPTDGGVFVPQVLSQEYIEYLYNQSSIMQHGPRRVPMPNGNIRLPRFNATSSAYWGAEGQNITESQPAYGTANLSAKKLTGLVPISNDLLRSADVNADTLVANDLREVMMLAADRAGYYGSGTADQPLGLANQPGIQTEIASSTTMTSDHPAEMLGDLLAKNVPQTAIGWTFNGYMWRYIYNLKTNTGAYIYRDEMNKGQLLGYPFILSNQIGNLGPNGITATNASQTGANDIWLGAWGEFIWGEQLALEIRASQEASYWDGSNLQSAYSRDQTLLRAISLIDFNVRHPVSFVQGNFKLS